MKPEYGYRDSPFDDIEQLTQSVLALQFWFELLRRSMFPCFVCVYTGSELSSEHQPTIVLTTMGHIRVFAAQASFLNIANRSMILTIYHA